MTFWALPFMRTALAAGLLGGSALAMIGVFTATRGLSFSGLAAAQWAALGTVVGVLAGFHLGANIISFVLVMAGAGGWALLARSRRVPPESAVATAYILAAGLAVLALSKSPRGESETLGLFFGNILALSSLEVWEALGLFLITSLGLILWRSRWVWGAVDPVAAEVGGVKVRFWNLLFHVLLATAITLSIHMFGVLLSFAYLVLPATAALLWARRTRGVFLGAAGIASVTTWAGFEWSFRGDYPTGPFVAVLLAGVALGSWLWTGRRH